MSHSFSTGAELLSLCSKEGLSIWKIALLYEEEISDLRREDILSEMEKNLTVMEDSIREGLEEKQNSITGLMGQDADLLSSFKDKTIMGSTLSSMVAGAMAVCEVNASMGRIVAAPTAGASGVLPGVLLAYAQSSSLDRVRLVQALFNAAAIGIIIAKNASISGAYGGCQAEVGSGAAMAASALTELRGGTPKQCLHAAAMSLKNLLGLVCDPVAGLVECPCIKRNAIGTVNAVLCSDMALAGIESVIPFDEVVEAMKNVGRMMHPDLRETARGGLAATPTAQRIAEKIQY